MMLSALLARIFARRFPLWHEANMRKASSDVVMSMNLPPFMV
jgi:hypothetical protein